jgi:hypothetical protein
MNSAIADQSIAPVPPPSASGRGRPRAVDPQNKRNIRVQDSLWDDYCRVSIETGVPINELVRDALRLAAPVVFRRRRRR